MLLIVLLPVCVYSQCEELVSKEYKALIKQIGSNGEIIIENQTTLVFLLNIMEKYYPESIRMQRNAEFLYEMTPEDAQYTLNFINSNRQEIQQRINTIVKKSFIKHRYKKIRVNKMQDMLNLHFLDRSLDNHALDFRSIYEYHIKHIRKHSSKGTCIISNRDDYMCLFALLCLDKFYPDHDFKWDFHKWYIDESEVIKLEQWCSKHYNDDEIASRFLNTLTDLQMLSKTYIDVFDD